MITAEQVDHFEAFGFIMLPRAFTSDEIVPISREVDRILEEDRQGQPFAGTSRQGVYGGVEHSPLLTGLVEDDRIFETMEALLGPGFIWQGSDTNLFVGDTAWHGGGAYGEGMKGIKIALYLDSVRRENGCLRVIPGSHRRPFGKLLKPLRPEQPVEGAKPFGLDPAAIPSLPLESDPGDVVIFTESLWHGSFGGGVGRRMFTLNFLEQPTTEDHLETIRRAYEMDLKFLKEQQYTPKDWIYGEAFLNSERPRIRAVASKLKKLGLR